MDTEIKFISLIATVILFTAFIINAKPGIIADIKTVKNFIAGGAMIVDVRTPEEYNAGNYKGSVNIPLADVEKNINRFGSKDQLIVVYCRSGNRSGIAKQMLERYGYKNVINGGGLKDMPD